jgi:hypothetical protein
MAGRTECRQCSYKRRAKPGRKPPIPAIEMTGAKVGRLLVLGRAPNLGSCVAWRCQCGCGVTKVVRAASLRSGATLSCGCLHLELLRKDDPLPVSEIKKRSRTKARVSLSDAYVREALKWTDAPHELIELKREQLRLHRLTREMKQAINEKEREHEHG